MTIAQIVHDNEVCSSLTSPYSSLTFFITEIFRIYRQGYSCQSMHLTWVHLLVTDDIIDHEDMGRDGRMHPHGSVDI